MTNKLIRISTTGVERVRTGAVHLKKHQQGDDGSLSEASLSVAETDATSLIDNTSPPPPPTADAAANVATVSPTIIRGNKSTTATKKKTHILNVEMSKVVPNDDSFEVAVEDELVISELVISSTQDSLDSVEEEEEVPCEEEESAVEVIYN
jgi:hypothetical protein